MPKKNSNSGCRFRTYHNIGIIICFLGTGWKALETQLLTWPQKPCGSRLPNAGVEGVRKSSGLATKKNWLRLQPLEMVCFGRGELELQQDDIPAIPGHVLRSTSQLPRS